jgi:hypothetical protein
MQRQHKNGERPRISVSLDPVDYEWVRKFAGPSDSYKVSRIIRAARLSGMTLDDAMSGGVLEDFRDWLKAKRTRSKLAEELLNLMNEYCNRRI